MDLRLILTIAAAVLTAVAASTTEETCKKD